MASPVNRTYLRLIFGLFVTGVGIYLVYGAFKRLGWI